MERNERMNERKLENKVKIKMHDYKIGWNKVG